jgi:hypothetical protein
VAQEVRFMKKFLRDKRHLINNVFIALIKGGKIGAKIFGNDVELFMFLDKRHF